MKFKPEIFLKSVVVMYILYVVVAGLALLVMDAPSADVSIGVNIVAVLLVGLAAVFEFWPVTLVVLFLVYCCIYAYEEKQQTKSRN